MTKEGGKRSGNGMLVGILSFLVFVIVGLVVGIIIVRMRGKDNAMIPQEDWGTVIGECLLESDTAMVECSVFQSDLKSIIDDSDDEDTRVVAGIGLAALYAKEDIGAAIDLLEDMYNGELSDQNKYRILKALMAYYEDSGDEVGYVEKLREIVKLPDSMEIEYEDWKMVKTTLLFKLEAIENPEVNNATL